MTRWTDFSDDELELIARGEQPQPSGGGGRRFNVASAGGAFLSNAADSVSLGFGDELMGVGAGIGAALDGGDYGQGYAEQVRRSRHNLEQSRFWHPGVSLAGSLAGGLAFGGGLGLGLRGARIAASLRNMSPLQRVGGAMASGGAFGGAYGAGSADYGSLRERLLSGATGAAFGAVTGGALQGLGMGLGHAWRNMGRTLVPEERAAAELGRAFQRSGMDEQAFGQRVRELQELERLSPGSNPMVMDALGPAGTDAAMAAATRNSAERNLMRTALDERNQGARERVTALLWRELGGSGTRRSIASTIDDLETIQQQEAAPLFAQAYRQTVENVPAPLRQFIEFNNRSNARFHFALETTRETMRRTMGAEASDAEMMRSPVFWHRLLENASAEVGAAMRAARVNPMGAPRGSAIADMTDDVQRLNGQVRALLGPNFQRAMNLYAGAARNMDAVELGYQAATQQGELAIGQLQRRLSRMSRGEREQARFAAITRLADELARADTGRGRADVLRAIIGNQAKRNTLQALFGGELSFARVMRALDYERELFDNTVATGIRVNSITADKLYGNQQMFAPNEIGGLTGMLRRAIGQEVREQYDEQLANAVLQLMRTPVTGPGAENALQTAQRRGLLSRAMQEAERRRQFRSRVGPQAIVGSAVNAIGFAPDRAAIG